MATTDKAWDGSASRWPDTASYCKSCLIDTNQSGQDKTQDNCKLPIREPNGDINVNALGPALGALNGARNALSGVSAADKKKAARSLMSAYREAQLDIPDTLKSMAQ